MAQRTVKSQQMLALVDQWRNSGLTQVEFCRLEGIKPAKFMYWVAQSKRADKPAQSGFTAVAADTRPAASLEVIFPNGVRLRADANASQLVCDLIQRW
jgi:hypothetical protein